jgi:conjugal transfer pilus assembly protein TraU
MNCADTCLHMRRALRAALAALLFAAAMLPAQATLPAGASGSTCHGRFINPITDICWSCLFPLTIGGSALIADGQTDTDNPSSAVCTCKNPPRVGVTIGFWEPARMVDVTRTPFCMVGLGGLSLDPGISAPRGAQSSHDARTRTSFYQVHWYANPILSWLEVLLDFPCLEQGSLDLAYLTEVDPLWADDELSALLNPEATLFANPVAKAACAADCVAASTGLPVPNLFWCAGCQGSIYPMTGHVTTHIGGVQASALLVQRMTAKMHRQFATFATAGSQALCGAYPQPLLDKTHYKLQMTYPVPATTKVDGQCCQPFGRTTMIWGAGKSFPVSGEDFSYQLFRKRNCCASGW